MKKNEAISILATSARPREPKNRTRYDEAVKMAIEALRQPERRSFSCGQENDAISRQAALDAVSYETFECYQARKDIRALPSADRTRVICGFEECKYWTKGEYLGVCTKNEIILDEAVDGVFVGCPDAEWDYTKEDEDEA